MYRKLLSIILVITLLMSTFQFDIYAGTGAANGTSSGAAGESTTGTKLSYGYRIGIGHLDNLGFKFDKDKNVREQFTELNKLIKNYSKHNYVKVDNPSEAIYCSIYNPNVGSRGKDAGTKIANRNNGSPTREDAKVFYQYLTPTNRVREETNYIGRKYVGTKLHPKKISDNFYIKSGKYGYKYLREVDSVLKELNVSKSECEKDIRELLSTDTYMGDSFKYWLGLKIPDDEGGNLNSLQFLYQYSAMLELYVITGSSNVKRAIQEYVDISEKGENTSNARFPAIVVESTISAYNGANAWWLSTVELLAYISNCNVLDFLVFSKPNGKEYTSLLDVYSDKHRDTNSNVYKNCPHMSQGWAAKMVHFGWSKNRKCSGRNCEFTNSTSPARKSWLTGIKNVGGPSGYFFATEFFKMENNPIPKGKFTWELSEGKKRAGGKFKDPYDIVKKKWGNKIGSNKAKLKSHKVKILNIDICQDKEKREDFETWIKNNKEGKFEIVFGVYRRKSNSVTTSNKKVADILDKYIKAPTRVDNEASVENKIVGTFKSLDGRKKSFEGKVGVWNEVSSNGLLGMLTKGKTSFKFESDVLNTTVGSKPIYYHYVMAVKIKLTKPNGKVETVTLDNNDKLYTAYSYKDIPKNGYNVNYYYDDVLDESASEHKSATNGQVIINYTPKPKEGFDWVLTKPSGKPQKDGNTKLTIKDGGDNLIEVYYKSKSKPKEYYYESEIGKPFSEIKCGYVDDTGSHEPYEAMAGFPTTENLYFASGGKEFVVQLKYKFVENKSSKRTYTQKSNEVRTSLHIPYTVKKGNSDSSGPGSAPAPEVAVCPTCGERIEAKYLPFRVRETRWDWKGDKTVSVNYQDGTNADGSPINKTDTAVATIDVKDSKDKPADVTVTGPAKIATATATASKVKATRWDWEWRCYGHADTTQSQTESGLPYSSDLKTYNNVHTQQDYKTTKNGKYKNVKTVVSNSSVNGTFNNEKPNGNIYHHISWDQNITNFNYAKITDVRVWQLKESKVSNMYSLANTDEVKAFVQNNSTDYLSNIAESDTAKDGRLWHSENSSDQDEFLFDVVSPNNYCHKCVEYMVGKDLKDKNPDKIYNNTTCVSDYLILRTSAGDLSMLYFDYSTDNNTIPVGNIKLIGNKNSGTYEISSDEVSFKSQNIKATEALVCNNINTFSGIDLKPDDITYGGYNGSYYSMSSKFISFKGFNENINVDNLLINNNTYSKYKKTVKPSPVFKLISNIDVPDMTTSNGAYYPDNSSVFYKEILNYGSDIEEVVDSSNCIDYNNQKGFTIDTTYSDNHSKINDVVVHDPVSTQYSLLIPLDKSRDQRTDQITISDNNYHVDNGKCPNKSNECSYSKLNCKYSGNEYHDEKCYVTEKESYHDDSFNKHIHTDSCYVNSSEWNSTEVVKNNFNYAVGSGTDFHTFTASAPGRVRFQSTYNNMDPRGRVYVNGTLIVDDDDSAGSLNFSTGYVNFNKGDTVRLNVYNYGSRDAGVINGKANIEYKVPKCDEVPNTHEHNNSCYKQYVSSVLSCDNPHHSMNTKVSYYTIGWEHINGNICTGHDCLDCLNNIKFSNNIEPSSITEECVLISHNGEYHIGYKSNTEYCLICNDNVTIDTHLENGKQVKSIFELTNIDNPSISTKSLKDTTYHYTFGEEVCWDPCRNDDNHRLSPHAITTPVGSYDKSGDFVNLDYGFKIYFPNTGNFYGDNSQCIPYISNVTGKGYTSPMDTTTWIKDKYVVFDFDVIYDKNGDGNFSNDKLYLAGEPVHLGKFSYKGSNAKNNFEDDNPNDYIYNFYVPLENREKFNTNIQFYAVGLNSLSDGWSENSSTHNFVRSNYYAYHDASKTIYLDIVGRIGALTMVDSGDFRFSNFFKQPIESSYLVNNIVKEVDVRKQNWWLSDPMNIRGEIGTYKTNGLNTYGTQFFKSDISKLLYMPLVPMYNNIEALKKQPQRIGYMNLMSLETIGNYYGEYSEFYPESKNYKVQIQPFYYHLDLITGKWTPVDVYMLESGKYSKINEFGNNKATTDYQWNYSLNWIEESSRRMYSSLEKKSTDNVIDKYVTIVSDEDGDNTNPVTSKVKAPSGREYQYGTAQMMFLRARNRTFIGSTLTEGNTTNPGNRVYTEFNGEKDFDVQYQRQAQRWHFSLGLPSSSVFVEHGQECSLSNIEKLKNDHSVIVTAIEVFSKGEVWTIKYSNNDISNMKIQVTPETPVFDYSRDPNGPKDKLVVNVMTTAKRSSRDDLNTEGTH